MIPKILVACCETMQKMQEQNLIQWKQKISFIPEGVYFCPPETTHYGATARRCGIKLINCPYCPEKMPQNAKELFEFNQRQRLKAQMVELTV